MNLFSDPGDELQIIHPLHFSSVFPIPAADSVCSFIERESLQGKQRPDHVFAHPLGLFLGLGPDAAVDIETLWRKGWRRFAHPGLGSCSWTKNPTTSRAKSSVNRESSSMASMRRHSKYPNTYLRCEWISPQGTAPPNISSWDLSLNPGISLCSA